MEHESDAVAPSERIYLTIVELSYGTEKQLLPMLMLEMHTLDINIHSLLTLLATPLDAPVTLEYL